MTNIKKILPKITRNTTYNKIKKIFDKFGYKYEFNREDIENIFNVKKSRASEIITLLLNKKIIKTSEPTKYKFINKNKD